MPEKTAVNNALTALTETAHGIPRESPTNPESGGNTTLDIDAAVYGINAPKAVFPGCHSQLVAIISGIVNPELRPTAREAATIP